MFHLHSKYKNGFYVLIDYENALELDQFNRIILWFDVNVTEYNKLNKYDFLIDKYVLHTEFIPAGYWKIQVRIAFDVNYDGRYHARVVADGNITEVLVNPFTLVLYYCTAYMLASSLENWMVWGLGELKSLVLTCVWRHLRKCEYRQILSLVQWLEIFWFFIKPFMVSAVLGKY